MKDLLFLYTSKFLDLHLDRSKPLLLAFSGGFDSTALLHLLLRYKEEKEIDLHIAHVDHGWREKSNDEAKKLEEIAHSHKLVFHMKKLAEVPKKNKEDICRRKRYEFFSQLCQKIPFQALLLAHQADDVAETVLKRILEGAHLINLFGMKEISTNNGLFIWRPLLQFPRKEIVSYLKEYNLSCIDDETNTSPLYLRSRMRSSILPFLSKEFGKEVTKNLCLLAERSRNLQQYLDEKVLDSKNKVIRGPLGLYLPESSHSFLKLFEKLHLVKSILQEENIEISRNILEKIVLALDLSSKTHNFSLKDAQIIVDKRRMFIFLRPLKNAPANAIQLKEGENYYGSWKITMTKEVSDLSLEGWENVWKGEARLLLPEGKYQLSLAQIEGKYLFSKLKKDWNEKRVPHFMRQHLPIVFSNNDIVYDFAFEKDKDEKTISPYYIVSLQLIK